VPEAGCPELSESAKAQALVLSERGLHGPGGYMFPLDPKDAPRVLETATRMGVRQVWVGLAAAQCIGLPQELAPPRERQAQAHLWGRPHAWVDAMTAAGWTAATDPPGLNPWLRLRRGDQLLDVVFPAWDERNPFRGARGVAELLSALGLYARHVGIRYRRSPGSTGTALMRATNTFDRDRESAPPPPALASDSDDAGLWLDVQGVVASSSQGWVHAFDVNGMYLAACSSADLGHGSPTHHDGAPDVRGGSWPAYWRASLSGWEGLRLPFKVDGQPHWYTTPSIQLARDLGATVQVREAYVYPAHARALCSWYERLRDARRALMASPLLGAPLALRAVKATYTYALGWLQGHWEGTGDERFRPDWRGTIIARARANMTRALIRVEQGCGARPVGLSTDTVLYWSAEPDPVAAAHALGLELSDALGKWKPREGGATLPAAEFLDLVTGHRGAGRAIDRVFKAMTAARGEGEQ
jgi:hypothetical protein